jgi:hypothetical protein
MQTAAEKVAGPLVSFVPFVVLVSFVRNLFSHKEHQDHKADSFCLNFSDRHSFASQPKFRFFAGVCSPVASVADAGGKMLLPDRSPDRYNFRVVKS